MAFRKVAKLSEIEEGKIKSVVANGESIALYKIGGQIFATTNICTHVGCELDQNYAIDGEVVECTCHGSQFNIKSGEVVLPPAIEPLKTFEVSVEGEEVLVDV